MSATLANTIEDFLADRVRGHPSEPGPVRRERAELRAAAAVLTAPLDALTHEQLERWAARHDAAPNTVARRHATLRRFFRWAVATRRCSRNPLDESGSRSRTSAPAALSAAERSARDAALVKAPMPYRLVFVLLRETGVRVGDVLALTVGDVCVVPGQEGIRVRRRHTGADHTVILGPIATPQSLRLLRSHLRVLDHPRAVDRLFRAPRGGPLTYAVLRAQWARCCRHTGFLDAMGHPRCPLSGLRSAQTRGRVTARATGAARHGVPDTSAPA